VGRTIYAMMGSEPSDSDMLIGLMDEVALAVAAVEAHNKAIEGEVEIGSWMEGE
jgi:hypothetical protein